VAQLLVRNLEDAVVAELRRRAKAHGRSLEAEVRQILTSSARAERAVFRELAAAYRATTGGPDEPDSTALIAEDRLR
jgi:plasmid stability protein